MPEITVSASDLVYFTVVFIGVVAWFIKLERDVRANAKMINTLVEMSKSCKNFQDHRQEGIDQKFSEIMRSLGRLEGAIARNNGKETKKDET